jgi:adenylate cyclase
MTNIVSADAGTVDKFIGDAVMAFWNAPRPVEDHAYKAVVSALACQEAIAKMDKAELLYTRIGIHTGRVMVGNFGAKERMSYTVLGDGVNLAARLEGVNKEYGTRIMISEATFDQIRGRIVCRRVDRIAVKGKSQATDLYEVLGLEGAVSAELASAAKVYEEALDAYLARNFDNALSMFERAAQKRPNDKAASVLIARCRRYQITPPPADWTGVSAMESK